MEFSQKSTRIGGRELRIWTLGFVGNEILKMGGGQGFLSFLSIWDLNSLLPHSPPFLKIIFIAGILLWKIVKKPSKPGRGCTKIPFDYPDSFDAFFW